MLQKKVRHFHMIIFCPTSTCTYLAGEQYYTLYSALIVPLLNFQKHPVKFRFAGVSNPVSAVDKAKMTFNTYPTFDLLWKR